MKLIKYIIFACIIFVSFLIIGESHIFYLDNFYTQYDSTTLYLPIDTTDKEMIADILNASLSNKVEVFTFIRYQPDIMNAEYHIYGTTGVEKYINEKSNIFKEKYISLFLGNINFVFNDIENISGIDNLHDYYIIGSKERVHKFKMDLIEKYAGNHPRQGYPDKESRNNTIAIWILVISIILLLSFYDVISQKKENIIRVSMGEKISNIIWRNILLDSVVFIAIFIGIFFILLRYSCVLFNLKISIFMFCILLGINGLLYLNLYSYDIKEIFSNSKGTKILLSLNYSLKLVTTIVTIIIVSSNIAFIFQSYSLSKQRTFFEEHSDYYYIKLMYRMRENRDGIIKDTLDESDNVQAIFNREFFEKYNAIEVKNIYEYLGIQGISANKNAFDYLSSKIDELRYITLDKDFYFLLPKNIKKDSEIIDLLKEYIKFRENDNFVYDYDVIYYHENIDIVGIDEDYIYGSNLIKNPAIIYNNLGVNQLKTQISDGDQDASKSDNFYDTMYKLSSEDELYEFNKFIKEHNLQNPVVSKTNVLEKYENSWNIAKRVLYINFVFSCFVLILQFIIITSIIALEYKVNAIELSIKKVMGYSILEKNWKIILMTALITILSVLLGNVVAILTEMKEVYCLAFGGGIILILELSVIIFYINKIENSKIQKILKGGNL